MILTYLIKFTSDGQRESTLPVDSTITAERKADLIKQGYIEVPAEEWQEYCNGKIRGKDGTPVDPPPYVPTAEEKLSALDSQYNADKDELIKAYQTAVIYGDTDLQESLKADLESLDNQYDSDYEAIVGEE